MPLLLAISGGKDSIVLLHYILTNNPDLRIGIVHINHSLRTESLQEELFVLNLAQKYKIPIHIRRLYLDKKSGNIEAIARIKRYEVFETVQKQYGYHQVATAHTQNDQLEQFFIRIFRGTSLDGLGGIPKKRDDLIRPLLGWSTEQIYHYIKQYQLEYMEDASNSDPRFLRNYIRHNIIPQLDHSGYTPKHHILKLLNEIRSENNYFQELIQDLLLQSHLFPELMLFPLQLYLKQHPTVRLKLLHTILSHQYQLTPGRDQLHNIDQVINDQQKIKLSKNISLAIEREWIIFQEQSDQPLTLDLLLKLLPLLPRIKAIPFSKPQQKYNLITTYPGAKMRRHNGSVKKIKDIMLDRHLPRFLRKRWPLVVINGNITEIPYLETTLL